MNNSEETADVINTPPIQKSRMGRSVFIIELRKTNTGLFKRRNAKNNDIIDNGNPKEDGADGAAPVPVQELELSLLDIINVMNAINDPERKLNGMYQARKMLNRENPPIDEMISFGIIPICIRYIQDSSNIMLQLEAAWALTKIVSGTSAQIHSVIEADGVPHLIALLESTSIELAEQAVQALGNIAGDGAAARDIVIQHHCIDGILRLIDKEENTSIEFLPNIARLMSNLWRNRNPTPPVEQVKLLLPALSNLLLSKDDRVLVDTCWALAYATANDTDMIQEVVETDAVARLVNLLDSDNTNIIMPALRSVGNIVTGTDRQTDIVIHAGALPKLGKLLRHSEPLIVNEATWTVGNITAGTGEQIQAVLDAGIFNQIRDVLHRGDLKAQKEAAWTVFNTITSGRHKQVLDLIEYRIMKPFLNLLDCKDSGTIKIVLTGLRNIFALAEISGYFENFCLMVDELGGLAMIRELQDHEHEEIKWKANNIVNTYYQHDND